MSTPAFVETPPMEEDVPVLFDGDRGQRQYTTTDGRWFLAQRLEFQP